MNIETDIGRGGSRAAGPRLSQAARSARTERRLLAAALALVAERGYERASLAAIGERAGYSRGVVTHAFGSKAGLLGALVERMSRHWGSASLRPAVGERRGLEALLCAIDAVREQARSTPVELRAFYLLLFEALGPLPALRPRFAELHAKLRSGVRAWIDEGVADGEICPDVDADAQAALFVGSFRGLMYQWLLDPNGLDLDRVLDEHKHTVRRALEKRPT